VTEGAAPLGVTGATGRLGRRAAQRLSATGVSQRLLVRDLARAPRLPGADAARASFAEPSAVREGLRDVQTVLMVSAAGSQSRVAQHQTFIEAAAAAGVRHLVYVSFFAAAPDCTFTHGREHFATEQHIRSSGLDFTFVRDNFSPGTPPPRSRTCSAAAGPPTSPAAREPHLSFVTSRTRSRRDDVFRSEGVPLPVILP
jgi:uncharacterized protein YbjT (DUF2867 family)